MSLHLTFGAAPVPYEWGVILVFICDLSIEIMQDAGWDPNLLCALNGHIFPPLYSWTITFPLQKENI